MKIDAAQIPVLTPSTRRRFAVIHANELIAEFSTKKLAEDFIRLVMPEAQMQVTEPVEQNSTDTSSAPRSYAPDADLAGGMMHGLCLYCGEPENTHRYGTLECMPAPTKGAR